MTSSRTTRGILFMIAAQMLFVSAWTAVKYIGDRIPLFELAFFRAIVATIMLLPIIKFRIGTFMGNNLPALFLRALFGLMGMLLSFYAISHMEIGNAVSLFNTLPIFVALLAPALLGERFGRTQFIFIVIAFLGILTILKPNANILSGMSFYAFLAAIFASFAMICIRKLRTTDSPLIITFYFTTFVAIVSAPMMLINFVRPTPSEFGILIFIGVAATIAQIFLAKAYRLGRAATIAPFNYTSVIASYAVGMILFSEMPDTLSLIGAATIIIGGIAIMLTTPKEQHVPGSTPATRI